MTLVKLRKSFADTEDFCKEFCSLNPGFKIDSWRKLIDVSEMIRTNTGCTRIPPAIPVDYVAVKQDLYDCPFYREFETEKQSLGRNILYALWECMFLEDGVNKDVTSLQDLTKSRLNKILQDMSNREKYISSLTDSIISLFRNKLIINDVFVYKCFEHKLEKILFFVLDNEHLFNVRLKEGTLTDIYVAMACDTDNIKSFGKLGAKITIPHLEYALRYATYDFLLLVLKMKKCIPDFDAKIETLRNTMRGRNWKQLQFFDLWDKRRTVN